MSPRPFSIRQHANALASVSAPDGNDASLFARPAHPSNAALVGVSNPYTTNTTRSGVAAVIIALGGAVIVLL